MNDARESDFIRRLVSARRGDRIIYYRGDLAYERWKEDQSITNKTKRLVNRLAIVVYREYKHNRCRLVQRRIGKNCFEYIAVKV